MTREKLSCEYDGHFWTREATRGRKPKRCPKPEHAKGQEPTEVIGYVDVPVTLRSTKTSKEAPGSPAEARDPLPATLGHAQPVEASSGDPGADSGAVPEGSQELYCQNGDHDWIRPTNRGRKPINCPTHPNAVDLEANAEERRRRAEERIDKLEFNLKLNGTHISQHQEKEFPMPNRSEEKDKAKGTAGSLKGVRRKNPPGAIRENKRTEAEARNAKTAPERRSRKKVA